MEIFSDLLIYVSRIIHSLYGAIQGSFLPYSCGWCKPAYWASEAGIVAVIFIYFRGPRT